MSMEGPRVVPPERLMVSCHELECAGHRHPQLTA
jgi:hypothetical protein